MVGQLSLEMMILISFQHLESFQISWKKFWFCLIFFRLHQIWISFRRNFLNLREILIIRNITIFSYIFSKFYSFKIVKIFFFILWKIFCHFVKNFLSYPVYSYLFSHIIHSGSRVMEIYHKKMQKFSLIK